MSRQEQRALIIGGLVLAAAWWWSRQRRLASVGLAPVRVLEPTPILSQRDRQTLESGGIMGPPR